jgi:hypothetical protein
MACLFIIAIVFTLLLKNNIKTEAVSKYENDHNDEFIEKQEID